jgi:hypothetical protein
MRYWAKTMHPIILTPIMYSERKKEKEGFNRECATTLFDKKYRNQSTKH